MPSYPNQSVRTGIDTGEGCGAADGRAKEVNHTIVSDKGSKLLLPHVIIAAIRGKQDNDFDVAQHEYALAVKEVAERDERTRLSKVADV